jgi:hypothetical protein
MDTEQKKHQSNTREYQIRVDGRPVYYPHSLDREALKTYAELCKKNGDCYVDIVRINTEIIMSQCEYNQMKAHFDKQDALVSVVNY